MEHKNYSIQIPEDESLAANLSLPRLQEMSHHDSMEGEKWTKWLILCYIVYGPHAMVHSLWTTGQCMRHKRF